MVKYKYDTEAMLAKIRETWSPKDFLQAVKNLGNMNDNQTHK